MSLIKSMTPLIKISQIFGVFPFKVTHVNDMCSLEISTSLLRYSVIVFWILCLVEGFSTFSLPFIFSFNEFASRLAVFLGSFAMYLSFIVVFRTIVKKRNTLCFWLKQIDDLLVSISPPNDSLHCMTEFNRRLLLFSTCYFLIMVMTQVFYMRFPFYTVTVQLVSFARMWIIQLFLKQFTVLANFVRTFYKMIYLHVSTRRRWRVSPTFWVKTLQNLKKKDLLVKDFVEILHSVYIPVFSGIIMWGFFSLLCDIVLGSKIGVPIVMQTQWLAYILFEVVIPTMLCHLASKEAKKMASYLQETFVDFDNPELLYEIETFSLQFQHRQLEFKVFGSLKLDCTLLYSMAGATWTYSIILWQFQGESNTHLPLNSTNTSILHI